jgi:hypothetical protein
MEYQSSYVDNVNIVGALKTQRVVIVAGSGGDGTMNDGSITVSGNIASTGGVVSGPMIVSSGTVNCASIGVTGAISCASIGVTGAVNCASIGVTGAINCASIGVTGTISCALIVSSGAVNCPSIGVTGAINCASIGVTGSINGASIVSSGVISGASIGVSGTISCASIGVTGAISCASIGVTGTVNCASIGVTGNISVTGVMGVDTINSKTQNGTTIVSNLKLPTTSVVTTGKYIPLLDTNGVVNPMASSTSANDFLISDGANVVWKGINSINPSGLISAWAVLTEQVLSGDNPLFNSNGTIRAANAASYASFVGNNTYNRIFTQQTSSSTSPITSVNSASYSGSTTYTCIYNFTLPSGTYIINGSFPAGNSAVGTSIIRHYTRLISISGTSITVQGTSEQTKYISRSMIDSVIVITANTVLQLNHYLTTDLLGVNFGLPTSLGTELYGTLRVLKIA